MQLRICCVLQRAASGQLARISPRDLSESSTTSSPCSSRTPSCTGAHGGTQLPSQLDYHLEDPAVPSSPPTPSSGRPPIAPDVNLRTQVRAYFGVVYYRGLLNQPCILQVLWWPSRSTAGAVCNYSTGRNVAMKRRRKESEGEGGRNGGGRGSRVESPFMYLSGVYITSLKAVPSLADLSVLRTWRSQSASRRRRPSWHTRRACAAAPRSNRWPLLQLSAVNHINLSFRTRGFATSGHSASAQSNT